MIKKYDKYYPAGQDGVDLSKYTRCGLGCFDDTRYEGIQVSIPCPTILARGNCHKADTVHAKQIAVYFENEP